MSEQTMIGDALSIARAYHFGQEDKSGAPYIGHPYRVGQMVNAAGWSDTYVAAAYLHDVLEDTEATTDTLFARGMSIAVVDAVIALTRRESIDDPTAPEGYTAEFIPRVAQNPIATVVKVFDLLDNLNPTRGHRLDGGHLMRYHRALSFLIPVYHSLEVQ